MYERKDKPKKRRERVTHHDNTVKVTNRRKIEEAFFNSSHGLQRREKGLVSTIKPTCFQSKLGIIQKAHDNEASLDKIKDATRAVTVDQKGLPAGIYSDKRGIYGYLPKKGSRYDNPLYDFSDADFVERNRRIRLDYVQGTKQLERVINTMKDQGRSSEEIARRVVIQRNSQKIEARALMSKAEVKVLEAENVKRYRDPIGPTPDDLFSQFGDWDLIIKKSMRKDPEINYLLGVTPDL